MASQCQGILAQNARKSDNLGPAISYDLDDRADKARVYEQVLRKGTEDDDASSSMPASCRMRFGEHGPNGFAGIAAR